MPEPVDEPALNGVRLNLRIVSVVMFNFASYLTIGLPLAVLPGYVHDVMGFSAFWAGLVISLQYLPLSSAALMPDATPISLGRKRS
ncbi:transporter [Raoultella ornithinolytica]|nr:transporter [Raoultella ornithinolytica]